MADNNVTSLSKKRVLGIPVIVLAVIFVVALVIYAARARVAPNGNTANASDNGDPVVGYDPSRVREIIPPTSSPGGVSAPVTAGNNAITTNDEWMKRGVSFLGTKGVSPGDAQIALQDYLTGADVSAKTGEMRDAVIREYGLPPTVLPAGRTLPNPPRPQGPLPRAHNVQGESDSTAVALAQLYYGRTDAFAVDAIRNANGGQNVFSVGAAVQIPTLPVPTAPPAPPQPSPSPAPAPAPRQYTIQRGDTLSGIAKRYYGDGSRSAYMRIAQANGIPNPNLIYAGRTIVIP